MAPWIPQIHGFIALLCLLSLLFASSSTIDDDDGAAGIQRNPLSGDCVVLAIIENMTRNPMSELKHFLLVVVQKHPLRGYPVSWQEAPIDTYDALQGCFMKPAIEEVGLLLTVGVKVTIYQGQYDVIASTIGAEAWVRKLKSSGLKKFLSLRRDPLHFCDNVESCSKAIRAYIRSYKNLKFYWILRAGPTLGHTKTWSSTQVPVDQPYVAFRMVANATQSPGATV